MDEGNYTQACIAFRKSNEAAPSPATLARLADCFEKSGKEASAWKAFVRLAEDTKSDPSLEQLNSLANKRAHALQGSLSFVTITVPSTLSSVRGLQIGIDGEAIGSDFWNTEVAVDMGHHVLSSSAPCATSREAPFDIHARDERVTITVDLQIVDCRNISAVPSNYDEFFQNAKKDEAARDQASRRPPERSRWFLGADTGVFIGNQADGWIGIGGGRHQQIRGRFFGRVTGSFAAIIGDNGIAIAATPSVGASFATGTISVSLGVTLGTTEAGILHGYYYTDSSGGLTYRRSGFGFFVLPIVGEASYLYKGTYEMAASAAMSEYGGFGRFLITFRYHL